MLDLLYTPQGLLAATILVFLAGLSEGIGTRGVVLLINRITPLGFVFSLLLSSLLFLLTATIWVAGIWLTAEALFGVRDSFIRFFVVVSTAYVPLLLGALAILPLMGGMIRVFLRLWSFLVALAAIQTLGLSLWQAFVAALAGTLLVSGVTLLLSEPSALAGRRFWALITGQPRPLQRSDPPLVIPGYAPHQELEP